MKLSKLSLSAALSLLLWGRGMVADEPNYYATATNDSSANAYHFSDDTNGTTSGQLTSYSTMLADDDCGGGDDCCDCGPCCQPLADLGEPCKWFDGCMLQERNITAGGWVAQSYTWNPYRPADKFNGPLTWTDRSNEYQLNEIYFFAGRAANTEGCGWDYGWRVDTLYGTNYRWDTAIGLETDWNSHQFYGLALPQAYVEIARNDLTVKIGHFASPVGYYTVGTANNFFPILPYTYQYGEPFTHTGVLANYKFSDRFSWANGFVRGWDNFDNGNPNLSYLSTATLTRDNGDTLAWVGLFGREPNLSGQNAGFSTRYFQTLVYTRKFSENVTGVLQSDYGVQGDALPNGGLARWYGLNSYLYWNQTCRLQWGLNGEWFRDQGGFRVGTVLPSGASPNGRGYARGPGFDGSFYRVTFGPKYFFTPNLYTRAALVADWYQGERVNNQLPFDDGQKLHQQVGVFDLVWTY